MADETATPVAAEATPAPAVETPPEGTNPEQPARVQTDWEAAYKGLQPKLQREVLENRAKDARLSELESAFKSLQVGQKELIKATLGEDQAKALDAQLYVSQQESARQRAAVAARQFIERQTQVLVGVLEKVGVDPKSIDWGQNATGVEDWFEQVNAQVSDKVAQKIGQLTNAVEKTKAQAKAEAAVEAKKLANEQLREAGVGRIDSSRGAGGSVSDRIASLDPNSKEFRQLVEDAKARRLPGQKSSN